MMKLRTALLAAAAVLCVGEASAADVTHPNIPLKAPAYADAVPNWDGWELALGVGGVWNTETLTNGFGTLSAKPDSWEIDGISFLNHEFANHVVIMHKLTVSYSQPSVAGFNLATWRVKTGPGVGYDFGPVLGYISGGAAAQSQSLTNIVSPGLGWYIGPGFEFKPFGNNVVMGVDLNYVSMNGFQVGPFAAKTTSFDVGGHVGYLFQ